MDHDEAANQTVSWGIIREGDGVLLTLQRSDGWHLHVRLGHEEEVRSRFAQFIETDGS